MPNARIATAGSPTARSSERATSPATSSSRSGRSRPVRLGLTLVALWVLQGLACASPGGEGEEGDDVRDTVHTVDIRNDVGRDADSDPYCHHDCFGGRTCRDGLVHTLMRTPVPCQYWTGACPIDTSIAPTACPHGCRSDPWTVSDDAPPSALCQPCEDPKKTGPDCDQCADPKRSGPDCDLCTDPVTHGPACDLCLGGPGSAGCPCVDDSECQTQICLRGDGERRCAAWCSNTTGCPSGFVCDRIGTGYPSACVPRDGYLCAPCETDADCRIPGRGNEICVMITPGETRCTRICYTSCPDGYLCVRVVWSGYPTDVCVPQDDTCP